jgi:hypothetical protein
MTQRRGNVVVKDGKGKVLPNGQLAVFGKNDECRKCCETCHPFTVSPADALAQLQTTQNYRTDQQIMEALAANGRPVFKLQKGKYSVRYQGGYFVMGCGRINCAHYHGYFVTSFGKLPGIVGGWGNSCCEGPAGYGYAYDQAQTLQKLEELKNEKPVIHTVREDGFIFKTGYYPWWSQSYVGGAMTFELCAITGRVTALK